MCACVKKHHEEDWRACWGSAVKWQNAVIQVYSLILLLLTGSQSLAVIFKPLLKEWEAWRKDVTDSEALGWDGSLVVWGGRSRGHPWCVNLVWEDSHTSLEGCSIYFAVKKKKKLLRRLNYRVIVIQYLKPRFHNCLVISAFMFFVSIMQAAHLVIMKYWKVLSKAHPRFSMSP